LGGRVAVIDALILFIGARLSSILGSLLEKETVQIVTARGHVDHPIGRAESIKRMACGFKNRERYRMPVLFHFGGLDMGFYYYT
jgi:hypothetical protein